MKRLLVGVLVGLMVGAAVPAFAHRDRSVSKHLYDHLHNVAHRVIEIEQVVWEDLPGFLAQLSANGVYVGPVAAAQVRAMGACAERLAVYTAGGSLGCNTEDTIGMLRAKLAELESRVQRLTDQRHDLCRALLADLTEATHVQEACGGGQ